MINPDRDKSQEQAEQVVDPVVIPIDTPSRTAEEPKKPSDNLSPEGD